MLLIDADGELIGSYGTSLPITQDGNNNGAMTIPSSSAADNSSNNWSSLDAASIGALISEVAGDYKRLGEELQLLDPENNNRHDKAAMMEDDEDIQKRELGGGGGGGSSGEESGKDGVGKGSGKEKSLDSGVNMKSLVIELEHGFVGVASAGQGYYVIALADTTVQQGALAGRLRSTGSHVREALSQLD